MKIRKATKKDITNSSYLVSQTFAKFNFKDGTKKACNWYKDRHDPKKSLNKIINDYPKYKIFYVAEENGKIIGIIRGDKSRIGNLFVDAKHHRKGIAKRLTEKFETEAKKQGSKQIQIRASIYSVPFYHRMGYKKTTGIRNLHGLKIQPMRKNLK